MPLKKNVLVICYSDASRAYLGVILDRIKYVPTLTKNASEGIRRSQNRPLDLIVLDGDLEEAELFSSLELLQAEPSLSTVPLVALIMGDNPRRKASLLSRGCSEVLTKPLDIFLLRSRLAALTGGQRSSPRMSLQMEVEIGEGLRERMLTCTNISEGGMFLRTRRPLPKKTPVRLHFTLPQGTMRVGVVSEVVHVASLGMEAQAEPGMGLRFVEISAGVLDEIRKFVR